MENLTFSAGHVSSKASSEASDAASRTRAEGKASLFGPSCLRPSCLKPVSQRHRSFTYDSSAQERAGHFCKEVERVSCPAAADHAPDPPSRGHQKSVPPHLETRFDKIPSVSCRDLKADTM
eukprot:CAMPEP_0194517898 /NCGR_PEP_ID=MMETSP0253-20130528/51193_1 /TAXON_ID=2966 /ORGANISM="Noctiluca scintillans" /LENGTH=120 /DNA_ID=CAMNT_0039361907 /DNA_START=120 /DNA_END=482 /DNA_ORIENTATION=+